MLISLYCRAGCFVRGVGLGLAMGGAVLGFGAAAYQPRYADAMREPWRWRSYAELSGLGARCAVQGADGTMWFGTNETVWSYDGVTWRDHPEDRFDGGGVIAMVAEPSGAVLAAGAWGLQRYDKGKWEWILRRADGHFGDVRKIAVDPNGTIWVATGWGLTEISNGRFRLHTSSAQADRLRLDQARYPTEIVKIPEAVANRLAVESRVGELSLLDVAPDGAGGVWLGADGGEVLHLARKSGDGCWRVFTETDGLKRGRRPSVLPLRDGTVWVTYGLDSGHLNIFDGRGWRAERLADVGVAGDGGNLVQTRDSAVWLSTRYSVMAWRDGRWHIYRKPDVPIPSAFNFIAEGIDGALWIGGPGTEIQRIDYGSSRWVTLLDLLFEAQGTDGTEWFLHRDGRVVTHKNGAWTSYDVSDGLPEAPVALRITSRGEIWVAGSHGGETAMARFDGARWERTVQREFAWGVDWRGMLEASDGSLWFAAAVDSRAPTHHRAGLLQYRDGRWIHHHQPGRAPTGADDSDPTTLLPSTQRPEPVGKFLLLGESPEGRIWAGRNLLTVYDGRQWQRYQPPDGLILGQIDAMFTSKERELWVGSRQFGAFRYDGQEWRSFLQKGGLVANGIRGFAQTDDGTIWAATDHDISRFDGQAWTPGQFSPKLVFPHDGGSLRAGSSGRIWVNHFPPEWMWRAWSRAPAVDRLPSGEEEFWTIAHTYAGPPPNTMLTPAPEKISPPGNVSVAWRGIAPWRSAEESRLRFSYRLNDEPWSGYTPDLGHAFFALPPGRHRLEVRARDHDFNVDPTPAVLEFTVLPPVWRQGWFIALMGVGAGLVLVLTVRLLRQQIRLRTANRDLAAEVLEHKRVQEELRAKEEYFQSLIEHSSDLISVLGVDGSIRYQSPAAGRVLLRPTDGPVASSIFELIHTADQAAVRNAMRQAAASEDEPVSVEFRVKTYSGQWRVLHSMGRRLSGAGADTLLVVNSRDVTEMRHLEDQFRQAQKMEALGQLAGGIAHDFNNLLTVIAGNASMLQSVTPANGENASLLRDIQTASDRAAALTRQLLVFSRQEKAQKKEVELTALVADLGKLLGRLISEEVAIEISRTPEPLWLRADPGMIEQVVMNLAINARDAMPQGGRLLIRTAPANPSDVPEDVSQPCVLLEVTDTGTGIPPDVLPKIFDPFFTTKEVGKGTGLGLATVFGIVQQHKGRIIVESVEGRGTTFRIYLPRSEAPIATSSLTGKAAPACGKGECILLVEDENSVRDLGIRALSSNGYRVLAAADGQEALALWEKHRSEITLLMTDLIMPGGLTGFQLARQLQVEDPELRVIYTSGYSREIAGRDLAIEEGVHYLAKPFELEELYRTVRTAISAGPTRHPFAED